MRIAVFGAGGVGGFLGARLAEAGADVHLIARGEHLAAIREDGLRLASVDGDLVLDLPATDDPAEIGPCDVVIFTVKTYDTAAAAAQLDPLLGPDTAVISFQNGPDNEAILADEVGADHVMGGVAQIFSTIAGPGVIEHTGGPALFIFGELDGRRSDRAERFRSHCASAVGVEPELSTDVEVDIWRKVAFISAQSGLTAAVRLPLGDLRDAPAAWGAYRRVVAEVCAVGRADGVALPEGTTDELLEFAEGLDADAYSSMHYDLTHGNRLELEGLHGAVLRRAEEHGVPAPTVRAVHGILEPWDRRNAAD